MINVVGVTFDESKRIYYYNIGNTNYSIGDKIVVMTDRGLQLSEIVTLAFAVDGDKLNFKPKLIERVATDEDIDNYKKNIFNSKQAIIDAKLIIDELKLPMKILDASFTLDKKQLLFNFVSDERIDFRTMAKKLASIYKTRIELRQLGVRDKAGMIGGLGQCGRKLCCSSFLQDMNSVSINMAKNQNLALNPQKINGICGRLMCCLNFENDLYTEYHKNMPKIGDKIKYNDVFGRVINVDLIKRVYTIQCDDGKMIEVGDNK